MHQKIITYKEPQDVKTTLDSLGLNVNELQDAAKANFLAQASCTANDAPTAPGFIGWNASVKTIREYLIVRGWESKNIKNSPRIVNTDKSISIMVATGDDATGNPSIIPKTKSHKGATTRTAIYNNEAQTSLFPEEAIPHVIPVVSIGHSTSSTWVLLVHVYIDKAIEKPRHYVRCELSMPVGMDDTGHIDNWRERIILPEITINPDDLIDKVEDFAPEQEIILQRKA
ncbi:MAG: hypothetical protein AABY33_10705 [Pseudomonadota bacterium]